MNLILASSSVYRRQLLERLAIPFSCHSPNIDESRKPGETPIDLVTRLAREKAAAVRATQADAVIIASDQLAHNDGDVLGKAGTIEAACDQLARLSGREVEFLTSLHVSDAGGESVAHVDTTLVHFRHLTSKEISRYVELEMPLDCAGSFKSEGLGCTLFERVDNRDPTALIGLPLIATASALRRFGIDPLL
ncbi:MAG: Maf family nucleotide pyrophosphatase [Pseudomonadaceae bacterium]|nr:Maf family nucleotide pyrophosphatase [Pseudomonadaceae bacterium]